MNHVMLRGQLAADVETRETDGGQLVARMLVTVREENPRRIDVVPVTVFVSDDDIVDATIGMEATVLGKVQRRFWDADGGRRSRIEIVAEAVMLRDSE